MHPRGPKPSVRDFGTPFSKVVSHKEDVSEAFDSKRSLESANQSQCRTTRRPVPYHATIALVTLLGKARPFRPRGRTTCEFRKPHYSNFAPAENRINNILSIDLCERQSFYNPLPHPFILHDPCRKIQEESEVYPV